MAHAASQVTGEFIQQIGPAYGDVASGFTLASGTVTALFKRERTGEPSVVDVSLLSTGMWQFGPAIVAGGLYDVPTVPRLPPPRTAQPAGRGLHDLRRPADLHLRDPDRPRLG